MGSPITFSGFNNVDFGGVLNAIMQQERAPIAAIEAQRTTLQAQNSAFATLATRLATLRSAAADLAAGESVDKVTATSSDEAAVGISTGSSAVTGRYEVVVSELARAQVTQSESSYASANDVVATSGAVNLARFGDPPVDVVITGSMTLQQLATAINEHPDSPVNASVVQVSPGQYKLVLTGRSPGTANGFTVSFSPPLTGGQGLTFKDTDGDGLSGDSVEDNVQGAVNAQLTVNQVAVTSATNTLTDVVPGVTLTLKKKDPASVVTIDVTKDTGKTAAQVEAFASAYNALVAFMNEQNTAATAGKPGIGRDPVVRGLRDSLRSAVANAEEAGVYRGLAEVGIGFDATGKITVDQNVLKAAVSGSPNDVRTLFASRFEAMKTLISGYTDAGGLVADARTRIGSQVARLGARIDTMEGQLAIRRAALQREFIAADRAMSQLNNQGSTLSQLGGQYRLF